MNSIADYLSHVQAPQYQNIPMQLRAGKRHVIWIPEERGDKIAKPPFNARALVQSSKYFKASAINPKSWSTFPQAVKAYENHREQVGGIGRVLADGIMLVDIDHCIIHSIDSTTGKPVHDIHPTADELLERFDTYHELSPSGDGIHIFLLARLPANANKVINYKGIKVEMYDSGQIG